jgi:hypothetical protein
MKFILSVPPEELSLAVKVALGHLQNCPKEPLSSMDFYVAEGKIMAYHSRLDKDTLTVWRSEIVEG